MADTANRPQRTEQGSKPTILVVASDLKMLKLLNMALSAEFECEVLSITSGRTSAETATRVVPDLMMIDAYLLDGNALDLSDQLHANQKLARVPTILINTPNASVGAPQREYTIVLEGPFVLVDVYATVHRCLGRA